MITLNEATPSNLPFAKLEFNTALLMADGEQPLKALLIVETDRVSAGVSDKPFRALSTASIEAIYGASSMLSQMVSYWLKRVTTIPIYVLPMPLGSSANQLKTRLSPLQSQMQFNFIVSAYNSPEHLSVLGRHLNEVSKADSAREGLAFSAKSASFEEFFSFIQGGSAAAPSADDEDGSTSSPSAPVLGREPINFKYVTCLASPVIKYKAGDSAQLSTFPDSMLAVAYAATVAVEAQKDPSRPFHALILPDVPAPDENSEFSPEQLSQLVDEGLSVYSVTYNREAMLMRLVTTYSKNEQGNPDKSFQDINIPLVTSRFRFSFVSYFFNKFIMQRYKLADDATLPPAGARVIQPKTAKAEAFAVFSKWEEAQYIEDAEALRKSLKVDKKDNYLLFSFEPNIIEILLGVAGQANLTR